MNNPNKRACEVGAERLGSFCDKIYLILLIGYGEELVLIDYQCQLIDTLGLRCFD